MTSPSPFPSDASLKPPVCVFCGSSPGVSPIYALAATSVGQSLAKSNIPLVYGGGRRGIMGVVSSSTLEAGGYVHGILPRALVERAAEHTPAPGSDIKSGEGAGKELLAGDEGGKLSMEVVGSMHERKRRMADMSTGGFIVLPGGYGTFEEMMEMITWTQLGIHKLPVVVLNVGNMYSPLRTLLHNAVSAGFIAPHNHALVTIVDLPGGETANADESRAGEWGDAAIKALSEWSMSKEAGYALDWTDKSNTAKRPNFSLFTTMRYTSQASQASHAASSSSSPSSQLSRSDIPLLELHLDRLMNAWRHFSDRDGSAVWGKRLDRERIWDEVKRKIEEVEARDGPGDWRVKVLVKRGGGLGVEMVPMPQGSDPFRWRPEISKPEKRRAVLLDPHMSKVDIDSSEERDLRLYKTTARDIYDAAAMRGAELLPKETNPEVLLRTATHLLESTTSNIAIQQPDSSWITPVLDRDNKPFLEGTMRKWALAEGIIKEGQVTAQDWEEAKREGRRIVGFNGLRGFWEAEAR